MHMTRFRIDKFVRYSTAITIALLMVSAPARSTEREALREGVAELSSTQNPMVDGAPIATLRGITKLYELRSWEPAWTDPSMVRQLFEGVLRSAEHGLNPDDFHAHQLGARLDADPGPNDPRYRADTNILCSDAFARPLVTLRFGKLDPSTIDTVWNFCHGCIRTEHPFDLAVHLLDDQGWDRARIGGVIGSRKTIRVNLEKPVTVMLLYWTTDVGENGAVSFYNDVCSRDARIIRGLDEVFRIDPPEGAREAVEGRASL
jgi:murein L,D-transpeptidase YcbB/YkuD